MMRDTDKSGGLDQTCFQGIPLALGTIVLCGVILLSCQPQGSQNLLKIGLPEEPRSFNIWLASDANSRKILALIYQPLYIRDPQTLKMIPWLAEKDPVFDKTNLAYTVRLKKAQWSDGSDFTADDVVFTRDLFMRFKIPRYYSLWEVVHRVDVIDSHTVKFYLEKPSAIFLSRVLTVPIVSQKEWEPIANQALKTAKPLRSLQNYPIKTPLGTGPFILAQYQKGAYVYMQKNPYFFGAGLKIAGRVLGPYVDGVLFKIYGTSDVAVLALKKGAIDMHWWEIQPGYVRDLQAQPHIRVFFNEKSALYYMGFNVRQPPFNDKALRQAIAIMIDKEFILSRILQNHGVSMTSIIPSGNHFWCNPNVRKYGVGLSQDQRIQAAYKLLKQTGYSWEVAPVNLDGSVVQAQGMRLPNGKPMPSFVILTPPADYDPKRAFAGVMIQEWLRQMGMPASARPMSFNSLIDQVKGKRAFDAFILGYGRLDLDPDYLRAFFASQNDKPRGWNMSGYHNPVFDKMAEKQIGVVDIEERKQLIWEMQAILMEDIPYLPLYNPHILEAVYTKRFHGWVESVNGIGNIWSLCTVREHR